MIPLYEIWGKSTCVLGMPVCQNRLAVPTWSWAMEILPPARVIELGSYNGAFATVLGLHCRAIGARMITYDLNAPSESIAPIGLALGVEFRAKSYWDDEHNISDLIMSSGVTYVLCDGGDKPRELATFAKWLKPGDVIAAHDYDMFGEMPHDEAPPLNERPWQWSEIKERDGRRIAAGHGLVPWQQEHFDLAGWLAYRKAA